MVTNKILRAKNRNIDFQLCLDGSSIMLRSFVVHCFLYLCSFHKEDQKNFKKQQKIKKREKNSHHILENGGSRQTKLRCQQNNLCLLLYILLETFFWGNSLSLPPLSLYVFPQPSSKHHPSLSRSLAPIFLCEGEPQSKKKNQNKKKKQSKKVTISPFPSPFSSLRKEKTNKQTSASTHTKSLNKSRQHQQYQRANKHTHKKDDVEHQAVHGNDSEPNKRVGLRQIQNSSAYPRKRSPSATVGLYGDDGDDERGSHNNNSSTVAVDWHGGGCERGNNKRGF